MVSTIEKKILDMLSNVREMRKNLQKSGVFEIIRARPGITKQEICHELSDKSERTIRRRLQHLTVTGKIVAEKIGRDTAYHLSTNPRVD